MFVHGELRTRLARGVGGMPVVRARARGEATAPRSAHAPIRIAVTVVVTQEVDVLLSVLADLQWLIDGVEQIVGQVGR